MNQALVCIAAHSFLIVKSCNRKEVITAVCKRNEGDRKSVLYLNSEM